MDLKQVLDCQYGRLMLKMFYWYLGQLWEKAFLLNSLDQIHMTVNIQIMLIFLLGGEVLSIDDQDVSIFIFLFVSHRLILTLEML